MKMITYTIGCYGHAPNLYFWSVPIRASKAWLQETLGKRDIIGTKLSRRQFEALSRRAPKHVELVWHPNLGYFLEAVTATGKTRHH
jgi:hypothetical protein